MQLMNQGKSNREFVNQVVKLQDELASSATRRPYVKALTEDVLSRPEREASALAGKMNLEYSKMDRNQLNDHIAFLQDQRDYALKEKKTLKDISAIDSQRATAKQARDIKGYDFESRPTATWVDEKGEYHEARVPFTTMIDYARMNDSQLNQQLTRAMADKKEQRLAKAGEATLRKTEEEITKIKQTIRINKEDRAARVSGTFTDTRGEKHPIITTPEFAAQFSLQQQSANIAAGKVGIEAQKTEFNQSRDGIKTILGLYGDGSDFNLFLSGEMPVSGTSEYANLKDKAATGERAHVENLRQVHVYLRKMAGREIHRAQAPPDIAAAWDKMDKPFYITDDNGVELHVVKEKGKNYLTILEIR